MTPIKKRLSIILAAVLLILAATPALASDYIGNARTMIRSRKEGVELIHDLDVRTANLQLLFSVLFTAALVVAKFF